MVLLLRIVGLLQAITQGKQLQYQECERVRDQDVNLALGVSDVDVMRCERDRKGLVGEVGVQPR
ncbi:MAG: hypothetical protein IPG88_12645 [Gemmatimonadetes bacterium]|nr:hypothetical protein [Gemmatimonadota bacterium]